MSVLNDGTVVPGFFSVRDSSHQTAGSNLTKNETPLRVGEVIRAIYPEDPDSEGKEEVEYLVQVADAETPYRCRVADMFGSGGDFSQHSVRSRSAQTDDLQFDGARVLIVCVNADRHQALIIGGVKSNRRKKGPPKRRGHKPGRFSEREFNGVHALIDDDGSFTLTVPGPTDNDGKPDQRSSDNKGTFVRFDKNGDVTISDQAGESVRISPGKKTIEVRCGTQETTAEKAWRLKAPKVVVESPDVHIGSDLLNPAQHGIVIGQGIDTLTGLPYSVLGNASKTIKAKE